MTKSPYVPIQIESVIEVSELPCDIFIQLSSDKYIKFMQKGEILTNNDRKRFEDKKISRIFVKDEDSTAFFKKLSEKLSVSHENAKTEKISSEEIFNLAQTTHETVHLITKKLGFTKEVQALTKDTVNLVLQDIRNNPKISELFKDLALKPESYLSSHSLLTAHISCGLSSLTGWTSDSTFYKLTTASFLHDITLEFDELARIRSLDDENLVMDWKREIQFHPLKAAELLKDMPEVMPDIDTIISQHHERPDGTGFPRGLQHRQISPLATVFIVAHDLVDFIDKTGSAWKLEDFIASVTADYDVGQFQKTLAAIKKSTIQA